MYVIFSFQASFNMKGILHGILVLGKVCMIVVMCACMSKQHIDDALCNTPCMYSSRQAEEKIV